MGKQNSKIVQITQAPSSNVHNSLKPFTDMSGRTLKCDWYQISDDEFYNIFENIEMEMIVMNVEEISLKYN